MSNRRRFKYQMRRHGDWFTIGCAGRGCGCWSMTPPTWVYNDPPDDLDRMYDDDPELQRALVPYLVHRQP